MELYELKEQISKKKLKPIYIFTGEEIAVMKIYIDFIGKVVGKVQYVDSVANIYGRLQATSMLNQPTCYVISDDKDYLAQDKIWLGLHTGTVQGETVIILIYNTLDKRSKFFKQYGEDIVEFGLLSPEILAKYIKKDIGLDPKYGVELAGRCNNNYSRIQNECDKIIHLKNARRYQTVEQAYLAAVTEDLIFTYATDVVFELVDSICKRQIKKSFDLLQEFNEKGEGPLGVISLLYNNFRSMLLVASSGKTDNIAQRTGLTGWQIKLAKEKGNKYRIEELVRALRTIRETEKGVKTGLIESSMALDYILVNVL